MSPIPPEPARRSRSIRHQITARGLALTALVLVAFAMVGVLRDADERRRALQADTQVSARIVGANSAAALAFGDETAANEILASLAAWPDVQQATLYLPDGRVLGRYERTERSAPCHALDAGGSGWHLRWCGAALYEPTRWHGKHVGTLALEVGLGSAYRALAGTVAFSAAVAALAFGLSIPLWRRLAARLAVPLTELVAVAERVGREKDFALRSCAAGMAEVETLAHSFNGMMAQLQQHDLRLHDELAQRRQAERRLNGLAYVDNVTGLHNRHYFDERIDEAVAGAAAGRGSCALIYIDLDGFKQVNDTLGHDSGDALLREVGQRLTETLRRSDGVCRLGGDEFAVIADDNVGPAEIEAIAGKLVDAVAVPYWLDGHEARVSASIGACLYPAHAADRDALVRNADAAMYRAKPQGKNRYCLFGAGETGARGG